MRLTPDRREVDADRALRATLVEQSYTHVMKCGPHLCGIRRMETGAWGLYVHLDVVGHDRYYGFEHQADAIKSLLAWSGRGHPRGPWLRAKGRMDDGSWVDLHYPESDTQALFFDATQHRARAAARGGSRAGKERNW
jgi:hypothetical protein